jgi:hypothetical protein
MTKWLGATFLTPLPQVIPRIQRASAGWASVGPRADRSSTDPISAEAGPKSCLQSSGHTQLLTHINSKSSANQEKKILAGNFCRQLRPVRGQPGNPAVPMTGAVRAHTEGASPGHPEGGSSREKSATRAKRWMKPTIPKSDVGSGRVDEICQTRH